jgi:hypothetical protein
MTDPRISPIELHTLRGFAQSNAGVWEVGPIRYRISLTPSGSMHATAVDDAYIELSPFWVIANGRRVPPARG